MDPEKEDIMEKAQQQQHKEQNQSNSSEDSIDYYADDTPLPKALPFDLKGNWLTNTDQLLKKFDENLVKLKHQQQGVIEGFHVFAENERKYKLSSLRKINIVVDKKTLYDEYMLKTRKSIEKLSPFLLMNIFSYAHEHLFYFLTKIRRVSKIFNEIYINTSIQQFLAEKDYLYQGDPEKAIKESKELCKKYLSFHKTFLYYKAIQYTEQIPQNSIIKDFQFAVNFINEVHRLVYIRQSRDFTYYSLTNQFMRQHRVVIGLSSLSLTSLVMVRKAAIIAFSNYLAFNRHERSKQQITKTKYSKVISVVEDEDYRDSLIINTKVSNYMWENHRLNFSVVVTPHSASESLAVHSWNFLIFHLHNDLKTTYLRDVELGESRKFLSARIDLEFSENMKDCKFATIEYQNWVKMAGSAKQMITLLSLPQTDLDCETSYEQEPEEYFSYCYFYQMDQYYIIAFPQSFE